VLTGLSPCGRDPIVGEQRGLVRSVNVDGCAVVAEAALNAGVQRLSIAASVHAFDLQGSKERWSTS
jgi:hypothetical protein